MRAQLTAWRDNDGKLQSLEQRSFLVKEVAVSSQDLSALAAIGLAALDFFKANRGPAADDWKMQQLGVIEQINKPKGQLLVMPAPAVRKLVEGVSAGGSCASKGQG